MWIHRLPQVIFREALNNSAIFSSKDNTHYKKMQIWESKHHRFTSWDRSDSTNVPEQDFFSMVSVVINIVIQL